MKESLKALQETFMKHFTFLEGSSKVLPQFQIEESLIVPQVTFTVYI